MGRKVNPIGFRLAVHRNWASQWFVHKKEFSDCVVEDYNIRKYIKENHAVAKISKIEITRMDASTGPRVKVHAALPGMFVGTNGQEISKARERIRSITGKQDSVVEVVEVRNVDTDANLVAQSIASRLEKRHRSRRVIQNTLQTVTRDPSVLGIKIRVKGRLEGADIARQDYRHEGRVPLHTLRADIDYGFAEAKTQMGQLGIKVWIYRGERKVDDLDTDITAAVEEATIKPSESGLEALSQEPKPARRERKDMQRVPSDKEELADVAQDYEDEEN